MDYTTQERIMYDFVDSCVALYSEIEQNTNLLLNLKGIEDSIKKMDAMIETAKLTGNVHPFLPSARSDLQFLKDEAIKRIEQIQAYN